MIYAIATPVKKDSAEDFFVISIKDSGRTTGWNVRLQFTIFVTYSESVKSIGFSRHESAGRDGSKRLCVWDVLIPWWGISTRPIDGCVSTKKLSLNGARLVCCYTGDIDHVSWYFEANVWRCLASWSYRCSKICRNFRAEWGFDVKRISQDDAGAFQFVLRLISHLLGYLQRHENPIKHTLWICFHIIRCCLRLIIKAWQTIYTG